MSVQEVCDALAEIGVVINRPVLSNLENGTRHTVSAAEVFALARVLDVPPSWLIAPVGSGDEVEVLPGVSEDAWTAYRWVVGDLPTGVLGEGRDLSVSYFRHDEYSDAISTFRGHEQALRLYLAARTSAAAAKATGEALFGLVGARIRMHEKGWPLPPIPGDVDAALVEPLGSLGWRADGLVLVKIAATGGLP